MDPSADIAKTARQLQIIIVALVGGAISFAVIAVAMGPLAPPAGQMPVLTYAAVVFSFMDVVARGIVLYAFDKRAITQLAAPSNRSSDETTISPEWLTAYTGRTIIGAAILQGCVFFCLIAYMIEGQLLVLFFAGLLLLGVLSHFPTPGKIEHWMNRQKEKLENARNTF